MTQTDEAGSERRSIICRVCGTVNGYGKTFCQDCRSRLEAGRVVSEGEALRHDAAQERRARRGRWRHRVLVWLLTGSVAGLLAIFLAPAPSSPLPSGSTMTSSSSNPGEWAMYGYDLAHTRSMPEQQPHSGRLKWSVNLEASLVAAPAVVGGLVYVATSDSRAVALDVTSGAVLWETPLGAPANGTPAVDSERLYVAMANERLTALDRETGEILWSFRAPGPLEWSPVVVNGAVYVLSAVAGRLTGVDAVTGEKLWEGDVKKSWPGSAVTWTGDRMLVATGDQIFYFDVGSGENFFTYHLALGNVVGAPAVLDRTVYVAVDIGTILALAIDAKVPFWERPTRGIWGNLYVLGLAPRPPVSSGLMWFYFVGESLLAPPAVTERALYFGTRNGKVVALDLESREPRWTYQGAGAVLGAPAVAGDTLYVGAGDHLYALSSDTGDVRWSFQTANRIGSDVVITAEAIYVVDEGATLYAIE